MVFAVPHWQVQEFGLMQMLFFVYPTSYIIIEVRMIDVT